MRWLLLCCLWVSPAIAGERDDVLRGALADAMAAGGGVVSLSTGVYEPIDIDLRGFQGTLVLDAGQATITAVDPAAPLLRVIGQSNPRKGLARFMLRGGDWKGRLVGYDVSFSGWAPLSIEGASPGLQLIVEATQTENVVIGGAPYVVRFVRCDPAIALQVTGPGGVGEKSFARLRVRDIYVHGGRVLVSQGRPYGGTIEGVGGNISTPDASYLFQLESPTQGLAIRDVDVEGDYAGTGAPFALVVRPPGVGGPPVLENCSWRQRVGGSRIRIADPFGVLMR